MNKLLSGHHVLVPVTKRNNLATYLAGRGAQVMPAQLIEIAKKDSPVLQRELHNWAAGKYAALVFTSANGVDAAVINAQSVNLDLTPPPGAFVAVVGQGTLRVCVEHEIPVRWWPQSGAHGEALVREFPEGPGRVLLIVGDLAPDTVAAGLTQKGWQVTRVNGYRTRLVEHLPAAITDSVLGEQLTAVVATSGSVARSLARHFPEWPDSLPIVSMGPTTSKTLDDLGLTVTAQAQTPSYPGVAAALLQIRRSP